ncbi:hypothetical protein Val02_13640 [Virgisporangium aliadipatigenens]|uniref:VWFA domain-containing protein n=1 Tax=Virgisporangium aliadipatigenens TaxID=741659 RepID=A0A8J3YHU3_9ACTN|nr:VWA domain-containing protein [Virgisporangium aliadipatigenens]GIJ44478.1 hypothetical protein Val02_13640 [Virgisporangium aliadipatigenens]
MTPTTLTRGANAPVPDGTIRIAARWRSGPGAPEPDLTGLLVADNGKVRDDGDMVFYNNPRHSSGAVTLDGATLTVALPSVPADVTKVLLAVSVHQGGFGGIGDLHLVVENAQAAPLLRFDVPDTAGLTALVLGELYRRGPAWKFRAVGQGWSDGLAGLARTYGINVDDEPAEAPVPAPAQPAAGYPAPPAGPVPSAPPAYSAPPTGPFAPPTGPVPSAPPGPPTYAAPPTAASGPTPGPPDYAAPPTAPFAPPTGPVPSAPPGPPGYAAPPVYTAPPTGPTPPGAPPSYPAPPGAPGQATPPSYPPAGGPTAATGPGLTGAPSGAGATEERLPIDMRKRLDLRKQMVRVVLEKKGATAIQARVIIVLDASGSMYYQYEKGIVGRVVERLAAVGAQLTPDGVIPAWIFASNMTQLPHLTIGELPGWIAKFVKPGKLKMIPRARPMFLPDGSVDGRELGGGNEEPKVMNDILRVVTAAPPGPPALVLFISDGGIYKDQEIEQILRSCADKPLFWQFVGMGGSSYGVLERLDTLQGRMVDNAGFFAVDDIERVSDEELYERLLSEFPQWIKAARTAGILRT